jgi:hypothetical protein
MRDIWGKAEGLKADDGCEQLDPSYRSNKGNEAVSGVPGN